ncbi:MAG: hypothetical protein K2F59_06190, partial [Eubacteriales bacterium]|nr:hypothetical protein [Eubacteriales bacterium]
KSESIKNGTEIIGARTKAKIAKNKIAPPFKVAEFDIMYGEGIAHEGDILDLGVEIGVVHKGGAWYSYGEARLGQGRENAKKFLLENPAILRDIENAVRRHYELPELEAIKEAMANTEATPITDEVKEEVIKELDATNDDFEMELEDEALDIEILDEE